MDGSFTTIDRLISSGHLSNYGKYESIIDIYNFFEKVLKTKGTGGWIGGNEEESKMRILTLKLFDRIFGEDTTGLKESNDQKSQWKRLNIGGWLREILETLHQPNQSNNKSFQLLLTLFSSKSFLLDSLERRKFSDFEMNILLFPKKARMLFDNDKDYVFVQSSNQIVYYKLSNSIKLYQNHIDKSQDRRITLHPIEYYIMCLVRYPTVYENIFKPSSYAYMQLNITAIPSHESIVKILHTRGSNGWISKVPYLHILMDNIEHFLPLSEQLASPTKGKNVETRIVFKKLSSNSEFFVRIATEFWMDGNALIVRKDHSHARQKNRIMKNNLNPQPHPAPTEIVLLDNSTNLPFTSSIQCMYLLVERLLKEPLLASEYSKLNAYNNFHHTDPLSSPPCINFIQQPLFDVIRLIFSRGQSISQDYFNLVVELWLLYLQPWILVKEKFSSKWEPYIAANFHFYTTLFGSYLQAVSLQDLLTVEDNLNFEIFNKVLNIFKEKLLSDCVQKLTEDFSRWYNGRNQNSQQRYHVKFDDINVELMQLIKYQHHYLFPDSKIDYLDNNGILNYKEKKIQAGNTKTSTHNAAAQILTKLHNRLLVLAPQEGSKQSHLGEVVQIATDIGLKVIDFISTPQKNLAGPRREDLLICQESLTKILGIDKDINEYQHSEINISGNDNRKDDIKFFNEELPDDESKKIYNGIVKCDIDNYIYRPDTLETPIRSDEIETLARLLINISIWLNNKFELPKDPNSIKSTFKEIFKKAYNTNSLKFFIDSFRYNLRPIARISKFSSMFLFLMICLFLIPITMVFKYPISTAFIYIFMILIIILY